MDSEWWCINGHKNPEYESNCTDCTTTTRGQPPSEYVHPDQRKKISSKNRSQMWKEIKERETLESLSTSKSKIPHCPTCRSQEVLSLGIASRGISALLGGLLFSRRARAHFTCKSCGYNW